MRHRNTRKDENGQRIQRAFSKGRGGLRPCNPIIYRDSAEVSLYSGARAIEFSG